MPCLAVCRTYLREAQACAAENPYLKEIPVLAYPDLCRLPAGVDTGWPAFLRAVEKAGEPAILLGACFLRQRQIPVDIGRLQIRPAEQCFYMLANRKIIDGLLTEGAYLVTPAWLRDWRGRLAQWGFDQAMARSFFKEGLTSLVLLDTGIDPDSRSYLQELSDYVDLPARSLAIGLDHFGLVLSNVALEIHLTQTRAESRDTLQFANRQVADYAMSFDLLPRLTQMTSEEEAVRKIIEMFAMIFAAGQVQYLTIVNDQPDSLYSFPEYLAASLQPDEINQEAANLFSCLPALTAGQPWRAEGDGFCLGINYQGIMLGLLKIAQIAFPEHSNQYLNLALGVAQVCGLVIANARTYQALQATLREKEILLKEVYHRVKNNLAVVSSLLYLQSSTVKDPQALKAFEESRSRVQTMMLVHESLYRSANLANINFNEYIRKLVSQQFTAYGINPLIRLNIQAEDVTLKLEAAIPCGLIINELVTNAMKYAFPDNRAGEVTIELYQRDEKVILQVSDNGVGLPDTIVPGKTRSMGLQLIHMLTKQIGGTLELIRQGGTSFQISIPVKPTP